MNVEKILRVKGRHVATIRPSASIQAAAHELKARGIGAIVVSADGETVDGILSERDIVHAIGAEGAAALDRRVDDLMTAEVTTCAPGDGIGELMDRMTKGRFRHLPVLYNGRLCGIVSIGDLVKNRLEEVESEADSLRTFITQS